MARTVAHVTMQFVIFFAAGLIVAWPSLNYGWYTDDLHLIRTFSREELLLVWHHTWDVDSIETVGYRPLTVLFDHARVKLFGEWMAGHRVFTIALFAAYLVLIGRGARRFGLTSAAVALAGVMMLCAKYSIYHFIWMTDGRHLLQGILFALALLAILRWVDTSRSTWLCVSVGWFVLCMLVREDTIAVAPVLVVLSTVHSRRARTLDAQRNQLLGYAGALGIVSAAALVARQMLLTPATNPQWTAPKYLAAHPIQVITLAGWQPWILVPLFVAIFAMLLFAAVRWKGEAAQTTWTWLACAGLASTSGVVESRVDLLLFPMTFYCLFAAQILMAYASGRERFGRWGRAIAVSVAALCVIVPVRESRLAQLSMAPGSAGNVETACNIARGGEWATVTAPQRRDDALRELDRLGLNATLCEDLLDELGEIAPGARLPEGAFIPPRRFLSR